MLLEKEKEAEPSAALVHPPDVFGKFRTVFEGDCIYCFCKEKRLSISQQSFFMEATPRFELGNKGFADLCLTTWLCRHYFFSFPDASGKLIKIG